MKRKKFSVLLKRAGLTIKRFSEITGTPYRTVQDWKSGKHRCPQVAIVYLEGYINLQNYILVYCFECENRFIIEKRKEEDYILCPYCGANANESFVILSAESLLEKEEEGEGR